MPMQLNCCGSLELNHAITTSRAIWIPAIRTLFVRPASAPDEVGISNKRKVICAYKARNQNNVAI